MTSLHKRLVWLALILLGVLSLHSFLNSAVALFSLKSETLLTSLSADAVIENQQSIRSAVETFELSEKLSLGNPRYLESATLLKMMDTRTPTDVQKGATHKTIENAYIEILGNRPIWPYTWINYMRSKTQSGSFDKNFDNALERSFALTQANEDLHMQVLSLGLEFWFDLSTASRSQLVHEFDRVSDARLVFLRRILEQNQITDFVCANLNKSRYEAIC